MSRKLLLPAVSAVSAGIGAYIGSEYKELKAKCFADDCAVSGSLQQLLSRALGSGTVFASTAIIPTPNAPSNAAKPTAPPANQVSKIMQYGFPSLDNVRAYEGYVMAYDTKHRIAHWVVEHLTKEKVKKLEGIHRDKSRFAVDESIHEYFRSTNEDYKHSGFDRGHLAAAGNHRTSQKMMDQTFLLSNMTPQVGKGFNRDAWNKLEKFVRHLTKKYRDVYVCTGPLFLPNKENDGKLYVKYEVIGKNNVAVPTHFFKVVVGEADDGRRDVLSFVMPNKSLPENTDIKNYLVPLEAIERASGLLLFSKLPKSRFNQINGKKIS